MSPLVFWMLREHFSPTLGALDQSEKAYLFHGLFCVIDWRHPVVQGGNVMLKREEKRMFKHILVPTDGSELSDLAVTKGADFAREIGARVSLFYAKPGFPVAYFGEGALVDPLTPTQFAEMANQQADKVLSAASAICQASGVTCNTLSAVSDVPYEAIIEAAEGAGCDLIFMASHGRRGISGLLLGSETNKVLTHSRIPVLVYR